MEWQGGWRFADGSFLKSHSLVDSEAAIARSAKYPGIKNLALRDQLPEEPAQHQVAAGPLNAEIPAKQSSRGFPITNHGRAEQLIQHGLQ